MVLSLIAVLFFYVTVSIAEGFYFHAKAKSRTPYEKYQHWVLTAIRVPVWILYYLATGCELSTLGLVLIFPFIHDGLYYYTRNKLNPFVYTKGFLDNPNPQSSNAVLDFTLKQRSLFGLAGLILIILGFAL